MKTISRIQYISSGETFHEQLQHIQMALDLGIDWVQVRWKGAPEEDLMALAITAKERCQAYGAACILNDHLKVANAIGADGLHLGLQDAPISAAKALLDHKIIGGTANSLTDVQQRIDEGVDYIGLGPFRFTTSKKQLSPILSISGYIQILDHLNAHATPCPPIIAIGGIQTRDVPALIEIGVHGIAISGLLQQHPEEISIIKSYYEHITEHQQ
ncbi:thiamine phosphate synthase [Sphingobacterium lactis]|uniref:thiamine phosphate synthase n=1 Tax=Sphingobacterium lactis TaxID=797291 RepID=UPI003DA5F823